MFLRDTVGCMIEERVRSNFVRNDLIDTLLELRNEDKHKVLSADNMGTSIAGIYLRNVSQITI